MNFENRDWDSFTRGDEVEVLDGTLVIACGIVDDFTADGQILWLRLSYGGGRRIFARKDGWRVRLPPA